MCLENTKIKEQINNLLPNYPNKRTALLDVLWLIQKQEGYISEGYVKLISDLLEIPCSEISGIISFYTMLSKKPLGKYHIQACMGICCKLKGAEIILNHVKNRLEINEGETSKDGLFHLSLVECLGSCGTSPMVQINDDFYEDLNEDKLDKILDLLK